MLSWSIDVKGVDDMRLRGGKIKDTPPIMSYYVCICSGTYRIHSNHYVQVQMQTYDILGSLSLSFHYISNYRFATLMS